MCIRDRTNAYFDAYAVNPALTYYNMPGKYTVDTCTAAGGTYPVAGPWTTIATIAQEYAGSPGGSNTLWSRQHLVPTNGNVNWVRLAFTASQGSASNANISAAFDVHNTTGRVGLMDGHFFCGDSIMAHAMTHGQSVNIGVRTAQNSLTFGDACYTGGFVTSVGSLVGGSGYTNGSYFIVMFSGGSGLNCCGEVTVSGGAVTAVTVRGPGYGYKVGDVLSVSAALIGGTGSGCSFHVTAVQDSQRYMGFTPLSACGGQPTWKASQWATYCTVTYPSVFTDFPGKYVWINLGANADDIPPNSVFPTSMQTIINAAQAAGKTVILEKIIPSGHSYTPSYNAVIATLLASNPTVIQGPDMSGFNFGYDGANLHPDETGIVCQRVLRAQFACTLT